MNINQKNEQPRKRPNTNENNEAGFMGTILEAQTTSQEVSEQTAEIKAAFERIDDNSPLSQTEIALDDDLLDELSNENNRKPIQEPADHSLQAKSAMHPPINMAQIYVSKSPLSNHSSDNDNLSNDKPAFPSINPNSLEHSSDQGSGGTALGSNPEFNVPIFLSIGIKKVNGKLSLQFTEERPDTHLGSTQGDHVISHRLAIAFCGQILKNTKVSQLCSKFSGAFADLIPGFSTQESRVRHPTIPVLKPYNKTYVSKIYKEETDATEIVEMYEMALRIKRVDAVESYITSLLCFYCGLKDVTCPKPKKTVNQKNNLALKTKTDRTSMAIIALNFICAVLKIKSQENIDTQRKLIQDALATDGKFVRGLGLIFKDNNKKINEIKNFSVADARKYYVGGPDHKIEFDRDSAVFQEPAKNKLFLDEVYYKIHSTTLIVELIACFLDYSNKADRKFNEFEKLSRRCFDIALATFPEISTDSIKEDLWDKFLEHVVIDQGWGEAGKSHSDSLFSQKISHQL